MPGPGLIASIAITMAIATSGAGSLAVGVIGLKAGTLAATLTAAALSSVASQVATQAMVSVLSQENPSEFIQKNWKCKNTKECSCFND